MAPDDAIESIEIVHNKSAPRGAPSARPDNRGSEQEHHHRGRRAGAVSKVDDRRLEISNVRARRTNGSARALRGKREDKLADMLSTSSPVAAPLHGPSSGEKPSPREEELELREDAAPPAARRQLSPVSEEETTSRGAPPREPGTSLTPPAPMRAAICEFRAELELVAATPPPLPSAAATTYRIEAGKSSCTGSRTSERIEAGIPSCTDSFQQTVRPSLPSAAATSTDRIEAGKPSCASSRKSDRNDAGSPSYTVPLQQRLRPSRPPAAMSPSYRIAAGRTSCANSKTSERVEAGKPSYADSGQQTTRPSPQSTAKAGGADGIGFAVFGWSDGPAASTDAAPTVRAMIEWLHAEAGVAQFECAERIRRVRRLAFDIVVRGASYQRCASRLGRSAASGWADERPRKGPPTDTALITSLRAGAKAFVPRKGLRASAKGFEPEAVPLRNASPACAGDVRGSTAPRAPTALTLRTIEEFKLERLPPRDRAARLAAEVITTKRSHASQRGRSFRRDVQRTLDSARMQEDITVARGEQPNRSVPRDDDMQFLHDSNPNWPDQSHDTSGVQTPLSRGAARNYPRLHREVCATCTASKAAHVAAQERVTRAQRRSRRAHAARIERARKARGKRRQRQQFEQLDQHVAEADRSARRTLAACERAAAGRSGGRAAAPGAEDGELEQLARLTKEEHLALAALAAHQSEHDDVSDLSKSCYAYRLWLRLTKGWRAGWGNAPPPPRQIYNYASVDEEQHRAGTDRSFCKLADAGAFGDPAFLRFEAQAPTHVLPFLAVTRASDRARAAESGEAVKVRLCLDCSANFNEYVDAQGKNSFFYAGFDAVAEKIREGDFVACGDLASYYTQIALHPDMWPYLTSEVPASLSAATREKYHIPAPSHWDEATQRKRGPFIQWQRLPFGVSRGCVIASMLTSEIVRIAEARGLRLCSYIDDILIMNTTAQGCADDFVVLESILTELGLKLQTSKQQDPAQSGNEYLGIEIDTRSRQFRVGAERQRLIAEEIRAVLGAPHLTVGRFRSLLGRVSWLSQVQRAGRSRTRPLYGALRSRRSRARVVLTAQDREDLQWFLKLLADPQWVGSRWKKPGREVVRIAKSDAGERGIGLVYRGRYAYYEFTEQERLASSHARELLAVALALELFGAEASGHTMYFVSDNSGTACTLSSLGTSDEEGQLYCRRIGDACVKFDVDVGGIWQPREYNVLCDALSKLDGPPLVATWVAFKADELAASSLDIGTGCLLLPRSYCAATRCHLGYVVASGRC